ncbi:hypothetical protein GF382_00095 [Candidatus Falkowbacteria bacterium]|nr:hypothetical protein [Candidatus Falkowbacteria bacterium]
MLKYLESLPENQKIGKAIFVSGFATPIGFAEPDKFIGAGVDLEKVKGKCGKFIVFHSDNDPYVPMDKAHELEKALDAELNIISKGGHLNAGNGHLEFPEVFESI